MNWMQLEAYLRTDDRAVLPLGCTEQHAYLSLATDTILAAKVAADAAEPLGVPVFPGVTYGVTPAFTAYPGSLSVDLETYVALLTSLLDGLRSQGFRRVLLVNGHGGNTPAHARLTDWLSARPDFELRWHDWWNAPRTMDVVRSVHPTGTHASWMENFPWTRLHGVDAPEADKPTVNWASIKDLAPDEVRAALGDGSFGGPYVVEGRHMARIWATAVAETRDLLEWGPSAAR